jgi:D-alanyl-lipoteichoic acid acyltransferase DltB (MBOAT superfamily)
MSFVPIYILIMLFIIVIDYFVGKRLETSGGRKRKLFLIASLATNIGVLALFKYYSFITDNVNIALNAMRFQSMAPHMSLLLPIGLSFYTFKAMSYTIEIYRGNQVPERNFGIHALYAMFYPVMVAGPIERPQNLLHQFYEKHNFDYERVTDGLKLMAWGLFKKVVVADRLAVVVDNVYNNPYEHAGLSLIIATFFFSFQIFCDFSGYSDMAIGAGQVMGFKLMENFNRPYHSRSISDFWRRWHISLSTWFRDYLYITLGGNRVAVPRWYFNLIFVFLVCGLWHGASWTFVIWGALQGLYIVFSLMTKNLREALTRFTGIDKYQKLKSLLQVITTFGLVTVAWIFFRARSVSDAFYVIKSSVSGLKGDFYNLLHHSPLNLKLGVSRTQLLICVGAILLMESVHIMQTKYRVRDWLKTKPVCVRWGIYYTGFFLILFMGVWENRQFIYAQF